MNTAKKVFQLQRLLNQAAQLKVHDSNDPTFKAWKNTVERSLIRVFGLKSPELQQFYKLPFFYQPRISYLGQNLSIEHRQCFDRDLSVLLSSLRSYIDELQQDGDETEQPDKPGTENRSAKSFISHASEDVAIVTELVELLEIIGVPGERIFCSSLDGYGIELGANFLDTLKEELTSDTLVLFVLSHNFYESPFCLCEMGATWVQTKDHIPILVPPFDFPDIQGVIPHTQGFFINDPTGLNQFKAKIESVFGLKPIAHSAWERKRDHVLARINGTIFQTKPRRRASRK